MTVSLDDFAATLRRDVEAFITDYRKQHEANPEHYPLTLPEDNAGLWSEFFFDFHVSGKGEGSSPEQSAGQITDYTEQIAEAVEAKLQQLDNIPYGPQTGRRLEFVASKADGEPMTKAEVREYYRRVMTDIAKRVGLHFFQMTPAVRLDQWITMSTLKDHDTAGLVRSLINSFLIAYIAPETSDLAYEKLLGLELLRSYNENGRALMKASSIKH